VGQREKALRREPIGAAEDPGRVGLGLSGARNKLEGASRPPPAVGSGRLGGSWRRNEFPQDAYIEKMGGSGRQLTVGMTAAGENEPGGASSGGGGLDNDTGCSLKPASAWSPDRSAGVFRTPDGCGGA
jgi:hypothetical protein